MKHAQESADGAGPPAGRRGKDPMQFYRRTWYYFGGVLFVALSYLMGFQRGLFSEIQVILVFSFMAMLAHQFEEYVFPGGFPGIGNIAMFDERDVPDRYPLNANQVMISNVFLTYPFYIIPILFPDFIWLGLIQVGQGMLQITNHGILTNVKMKSLYNPGLASCILLQWPVGLYYIWFVETHHLVTTTDYVVGFFGTCLSFVVLWLGPIGLLRDKHSRHAFTEAEMFRYRPEKLKELLRS